VGVSRFLVLPQVSPAATFATTLLALSPALASLWRDPHPRNLPRAVAYANLCGFMFGYHVHEKAALTVTVPLALVATQDAGDAVLYLVMATAGHVGMFPLLFQRQELPIRWLVVLLYTVVVWDGLWKVHGCGGKEGEMEGDVGAPWGQGGEGHPRVTRSQTRGTGKVVPGAHDVIHLGQGKGWTAWPVAWPLRMYLWGFVPLELYCALVHEWMLGARLPFAPLMLTSVYCALGVAWVWGVMAVGYVREALGEGAGRLKVH